MAVAEGRTPEEVAAGLGISRASLYRPGTTGLRCDRLPNGTYEASIINPELFRRFRERQARRTTRGSRESLHVLTAPVIEGTRGSPGEETPAAAERSGAPDSEQVTRPASGSTPYLGQLPLDMDLNERENAHLIGHLNAQANLYELARKQMEMMQSGLGAMKEQMAMVQRLLDRLPPADRT